jgi:hypothetical protein
MGKPDLITTNTTLKAALFLAGLILICGMYSTLSQVEAASSVNTKVKIRVVPLECIIEQINNGITEIYFLEPLECDDIINPKPPPGVKPLPNPKPGVLPGILPIIQTEGIYLRPADAAAGPSQNEQGNEAENPTIKASIDLTPPITKLAIIVFSLAAAMLVLMLILYLLTNKRF